MPINTPGQAKQLLANSGRRRLITQALADKGKRGDTVLAHIEPQEALALKMAGGAGTRNPETGLPQFYPAPPRPLLPQGPDEVPARSYDPVVEERLKTALGGDPDILSNLMNPEEPGWKYGGLLPWRQNETTGENQIAWPGMVRDLAQGTWGLMKGAAGEREGMSDSADAMQLATGGRMTNQQEMALMTPALAKLGVRGDPLEVSAMGTRGPRGRGGAPRRPPTKPIKLMVEPDEPPPPRGHNMPPEMLDEEPPPSLAEKVAAPEGPEGFGTAPPPEAPAAPAAPTKKRGSVTDVSLRDMTHDEAVAAAREGHHLKQDPKTGQYYGAPRGITTPEQLQALRDDFDRHVENGLIGRPWYDRSQEANLEMTGDEPARSQLMAHENALFSSQAEPDPNFGFGLKAHNAYEMGVPPAIVHTGAQARKYVASRQMEERGEGLMDLGPKTKPFQEHVDPTRANPSTSVNDIWHARAWGYKGPTGETLFDRAPTAQEHAFMDAETVLAADRANQRALGGFTDWGSGHVQASSWVGRKAQQIMTDQEAKREKALAEAGEDAEAQAAAHAKYPPISMQDALLEAKKDFSDAVDKYTGNEVYEQIPGADTGHLPSLTKADYATRKAYSEAAPWANEKGYDPLWRSTGFYQRPTVEAQGYFTPTGKTEAEANPARTARPMIDYTATKQGLVPSDVSQGAMRGVGTLRAYMDAQNMGAAHKLLFKGQPGQMGSVHIPFQRSLTPDEITGLGTAVKPYGLSPSDTGRGVSLLNFGPEAGGPLPKNIPGMISGDLGTAVKRALPDAGPLQRKRQFSEAYLVDKDMNPLLAKANEGSGIATRRLFETLDNPDVPALAARMDTPELRTQAHALLARDEAYAAKTGDPIRADIQNARRVLAKGGLTALRDALREGKIPLPAVAGLGLTGLLGAEFSTSGQAQAAEPGAKDMPDYQAVPSRQPQFGAPLDTSGLNPSAADITGVTPWMRSSGPPVPPVQNLREAQALLRDHARRQLITQALAAQGTHGDTMLAHLSPREALALKLSGGVGTRNPRTGIPQFYGGGYGHASGDTNAGDPTSPGSSGGYGAKGESLGGKGAGPGGEFDPNRHDMGIGGGVTGTLDDAISGANIGTSPTVGLGHAQPLSGGPMGGGYGGGLFGGSFDDYSDALAAEQAATGTGLGFGDRLGRSALGSIGVNRMDPTQQNVDAMYGGETTGRAPSASIKQSDWGFDPVALGGTALGLATGAPGVATAVDWGSEALGRPAEIDIGHPFGSDSTTPDWSGGTSGGGLFGGGGFLGLGHDPLGLGGAFSGGKVGAPGTPGRGSPGGGGSPQDISAAMKAKHQEDIRRRFRLALLGQSMNRSY